MNENEKAKFFAHYLGQKCRRQNIPAVEEILSPDTVTGRVVEVIADGKYPDAFLLLRSIADLTEDEYKILASWSAYRLTDKNIIDVGKSMANHLLNVNGWGGDEILRMTDYLRSIGVLLPYTYLNDQNEPITITPEQIIEKGWAKVK